jgi:nucleoside-diphosphate-sugar epimerase
VPAEAEALARHVERPQRLGDEVLLGTAELDCGTAELLSLGGGETDEEGLSRYLDIQMISSGAMARKAFLLGGTGKTGRVLAERLLETGWEVVVASRGERPVETSKEARHVKLDRADDPALRAALGDGVDVLVDFVAFEPAHAEQLLALRGLTRSLVVVSSSSVYADPAGRSLDEARAGEEPEFRVPLTEREPTVRAGDETYSTRKVAIERALLGQDAIPSTLVRAGAIYGPGDLNSREWYFVKRALDGRRVVVLAHRGASRFQPTSVHNLAELIRLAAERPGRRLLNCGDPQAPSVAEIGRYIAAAMTQEWAEVLLPGPPRAGVGDNPWGVPRPFVLDMTEAEFEVGYRPVTTYDRAVGETCEWLVSATEGRDWREVLPVAARLYGEEFDYAAEDELLRGLTAG